MYFIIPKKILFVGVAEFADDNQVRVIGLQGNQMLQVNGLDDYSPRANTCNTETISR